jgi:hypothetical protein
MKKRFSRVKPVQSRILYLLLALISLIIGVIIYYYFHSLELIINKWLNIHVINNPIEIDENLISSFIIYSFPDGLWFLAGKFLIRSIWMDEQKTSQIYKSLFCLFGFGFELLQISPIIPGTFDVFDLLLMVLIAFIESMVYKFLIRRRIDYV